MFGFTFRECDFLILSILPGIFFFLPHRPLRLRILAGCLGFPTFLLVFFPHGFLGFPHPSIQCCFSDPSPFFFFLLCHSLLISSSDAPRRVVVSFYPDYQRPADDSRNTLLCSEKEGLGNNSDHSLITSYRTARGIQDKCVFHSFFQSFVLLFFFLLHCSIASEPLKELASKE